jgi:hypothetical protein
MKTTTGPGAEVVGGEADTGERSPGEDADEMARMDGERVDGENAHAIVASVAASPSMLSSRLNAFVMPISHARR